MKEDLVLLVKAIALAQKRGCYSLEESAIIYQCLKGMNTCPTCNPQEDLEPREKKDLDVISGCIYGIRIGKRHCYY